MGITCITVVEYIYLFIMLGVFPLYVKNQYENIGSLKYTLFLRSTVIFLVVTAAVVLAGQVLNLRAKKTGGDKVSPGKPDSEEKTGSILSGDRKGVRLSILDKSLLCYGLCVLISFGISENKSFALTGAQGWNMGLISQLLFLAVYVVLSRRGGMTRTILGIHIVSSGLVFALGVLHRFGIDPLKMYTGLTMVQKKEFLSTLGQATWYSSYVCVGLGLGIMVFVLSESRVMRVLSTGYMVLAFATLVTQNSDSAFAALGGILLLLGLFCMSEGRYPARFWQLLTLMWAVFGGMGILQRIFADRMTELDSLSLFFSQSPLVWVFLILSGAAAFAFTGAEGKITDGSKKKLQTGYRIFLAAVVVSLLAAVVFIYLNTRGYLLSWFGWQSTNSYLYFDILWGNMRGSTWILSWETYRQMPLLNQIFGVGPDSFASYMYSDPGRAEYLQQFWGGLTLSNAHNEYLNSLICYGAVGVTAWTGALVCGIRRFYRLAKKEPFFLAFALCTIGYACHNFFCYQQVCCTPFLFIFWGLGEGRAALRGESLDKTEKIT